MIPEKHPMPILKIDSSPCPSWAHHSEPRRKLNSDDAESPVKPLAAQISASVEGQSRHPMHRNFGKLLLRFKVSLIKTRLASRYTGTAA